MGVQGLFTLIEEKPRLYEEIRFRNSRLVIDGQNLIYLLYFSSGLDQRHSGEYGAFEDLIEKFIKALRKCGVEPYVVLDGGAGPTNSKLETLKKRAEDRIQKAHNTAIGQQENVLPPLMKLVVRQTLVRLGVPVAQCFGEADIQIASLAREWGCPVLSSDSDFYIFDLPGGLLPISHFKWEAEAQGGIPCKRYTTASFCVLFNIQREILPVFAALAGNDYVNLREMGVYPRWADFAPSGRGKTARLEGLLHLLRGFQRPQEALNAALKKMGNLSRMKEAEVRQVVTLGMDEYRLPPSDLASFFTKGTPPVLPEALGLVPDWARLPLTEGRLSGDILDALLLKRMKLSAPVDHCSKPSANITSRPVRQVMYGLLLGGNSRTLVEEWDREGLQLAVVPVRPVLRGAAQQLKLETLDKADRPLLLQVFLETLAVKQEVLDGVPTHLRLPVAVTCYWLQKASPPPDLRLLQALLLGMVTGTRALQAVPTQPTHTMDLDVAHSFNQWQACMRDSIHLHQLIGCPLPEAHIASLYEGTLAHRLVSRLKSEADPERLLSEDRRDRELYRALLAAVHRPVSDLTAELKQIRLLD